MKIIITCLLFIFTFPIFSTSAYQEDTYRNHLQANQGRLPRNEDKIIFNEFIAEVSA
jgi:hypothetical protein